MRSRTAQPPLRLMLVAMLAVVLSVIPAVAAAEVADPCGASAEICLGDAASQTVTPQGELPPENGHEHVPGPCGGCHVHLLSVSADAYASLAMRSAKHSMSFTRSWPLSSGNGLYRPPRS